MNQIDFQALPGGALVQRGLQDLDAGIESEASLLVLIETIVSSLHRYPAVDPAGFRRALEEALART